MSQELSDTSPPVHEAAFRCNRCDALLDEEDLFCANCGAEAPQRTAEAVIAGSEIATHSFQCDGCGASMSYDAHAQDLRCPFCGSQRMTSQKETRTLAAKTVVPFEIDAASAQRTLRQWLGSSFWRPSDLAQQAVVEKLSQVFVPYWVFEAHTLTYWTGDSSQVPWGARGDWCPHFGHHRSRYAGVLVGASRALTPAETQQLCPFDISRGVSRQSIDLEPFTTERFVVQRKYARPLARGSIESLERDACAKFIPGRSRNVKVNVRLEGLQSTPVLLPVWIMAYRYKDQVYRFLINGQSGRHHGQAPFSYWKLALILGAFGAVALLFILFLLLVS